MSGRATKEIVNDLWAMSGLVIGTAQIREISDRLERLEDQLDAAYHQLARLQLRTGQR